jgi:hypothetical protein
MKKNYRAPQHPDDLLLDLDWDDMDEMVVFEPPIRGFINKYGRLTRLTREIPEDED